MSLLEFIKGNSRVISDELAGSDDYFELATTNLSLYCALRKAAESHARGRLLDAGAGRMAYRMMLEEYCDSYEALDISDPTGRMDHIGDLHDTGLPDESYDTIFCTQVLQHLAEPWRAVEEMARLLKPGGRVIVSAPHLVWLHNEPHDYYRFTCHGMRYLLERAGLRPLEVRPVGGVVCFLAYAPSTAMLALMWPVRPLFRAALAFNKVLIRAALLLDRFTGFRSLYPTNFIAVAEKPKV